MLIELRIARIPLLGALALSLSLSTAGCGDPEELRIVSPPPGLELLEPTLFSVDTEQERFAIPVADGLGETVAAVLADSSGRRSLELVGGPYTGDQVRGSGWVLLAAAARDEATLCVCWSELTGVPGALTQGELPHPEGGLGLFCRFRDASGWSSPVDLTGDSSATWLQTVTAVDGAFEVQYRSDSGWLLVSASAADGAYVRRIVPGQPPSDPVRVGGAAYSVEGKSL